MGDIASFIDTETTGLSSSDKVINLAAIFFHIQDSNTYEYIGHCNIFNMVDRTISTGSQQIHGISPKKLEELSGGKRYTEYLDDVYDYMSCVSNVYAHNISFDIRMIVNTYGQVFSPKVNLINTMDCAKQYLGRRCNLQDFVKIAQVISEIPTETIANDFKVLYGEGGYHGALYDAFAMTRAYMLLNNIQWTYPNT